MNIFKRLKNLWRLSEYEPLENSTAPAPGDVISSVVRKKIVSEPLPKEPAVIVDMHDPIKDTQL